MAQTNKEKHIITSVSEQKKNKDRYAISINNQYYGSLSKDLFYKYDFREGDEVSLKELNDAIFEDNFKRAYLGCLNLISYRPRSVFEIRSYLKRKKYGIAIRESVVEKLINDTYLDDDRFTQEWIKDRLAFKQYSRLRVKKELQEKGITKEKIDHYLDKLYSVDKELEIAKNRACKYLKERRIDSTRKNEKLGKYLYSCGFSYETINEVIKDLEFE